MAPLTTSRSPAFWAAAERDDGWPLDDDAVDEVRRQAAAAAAAAAATLPPTDDEDVWWLDADEVWPSIM